MNLAWRDVRHQWRRFVATAVGLGLLFSVVLAMGGIYRGMVEDAVILVDRMHADLWIVQRGTRGPFAERSVISETLEARARAVPGVAWAHTFSTLTIEPVRKGRVLRISLVGLAWPEDRGAALPLVAGRPLGRGRGEVVVDHSLGLALGESIELGDETYTVVGVGRGLLSSSGDGLAFVSQQDLGRVESWVAPEARRTASASARTRAGTASAVLVKVADGASLAAVERDLASWTDVSVHSSEAERRFLLDGVVDKARRQIGLFRGLLSVVSGIVVSLVIFNMTVAKTREIALLKLMGAKLELVVGMILQQSMLLTLLAYAVAVLASQLAFPHFPRRVVVGVEELTAGLGLAIGIAFVASLAAIRRAFAIPSTTILAG